MEADKDLEQQYRKNLMIVASVVFVYSIAGGQMGNELSLLSAKLTFSHPVLLEYAMVIIMCFFWWRHRQVSYNIRRDFVKKVYGNLIIPKWVYRRLMREGTKHIEPIYYEGPDRVEIHAPLRPFWDVPEEVGILWLSGGVRSADIIAYSLYENESTDNLLSDIKIKMSWLMRFCLCMAYTRSFIMISYKKTEFGDGVLPTIFFAIALGGWVINHFQLIHIAM
ncbi:hypothetical protein [Aeromonas hydrophila]|uniref:hypothetical protein n=1 Tax=Aeromonas hydrophila TaxID=644 RepID=UPI000A8DE65E|nr:hypothetical protein [Aeromonas hydrophila]